MNYMRSLSNGGIVIDTLQCAANFDTFDALVKTTNDKRKLVRALKKFGGAVENKAVMATRSYVIIRGQVWGFSYSYRDSWQATPSIWYEEKIWNRKTKTSRKARERASQCLEMTRSERA